MLTKQVSCENDCINVNYHKQWLSFSIKVRFNPPHPGIDIWFLTNLQEPVNKGTRAGHIMVLEQKKKQLDSCNVKPTHTSNIWISNHKGSITAGDLELPHLGVECTHSLSMPWTLQISLGAWRMLWFNLFRVEIRELRPKVVAKGEGVLVHYLR